jgi:histidyl-tRNA synthetase
MKMDPISGFPEWTPAQRRLEQQWMQILQQQFELYAFASVETRAIEPLDVLLNKGDDKEIYLLKRLHATEEEADKFGLHFDLTVPFARYVQEFEAQLSFPFKRYQIQKVWRGERKQEGRYREFYQCDLDIIGKDQLPLHFDAELAYLLADSLARLPIPPVDLKISHRKVLEGFYRGLGIEDIPGTLRILDKLAKIGVDGVLEQLGIHQQLPEKTSQACIALAQIRSQQLDVIERVRALGVSHPQLDEGLAELQQVMTTLHALDQHQVWVDLSIARGLDYYTGTVYEGYLRGHESLGAICSGGRYDRLAGSAQKPLPGVGVSIGLTRLLGFVLQHDLVELPAASSAQVYIILPDDSARVDALRVASQLRARGIAVDIHHQPQNFGKQMRHAEKRGIPYVWFLPGTADVPGHAVKHLASGAQQAADPGSWVPV